MKELTGPSPAPRLGCRCRLVPASSEFCAGTASQPDPCHDQLPGEQVRSAVGLPSRELVPGRAPRSVSAVFDGLGGA
jgi:hypothetical protein